LRLDPLAGSTTVTSQILNLAASGPNWGTLVGSFAEAATAIIALVAASIAFTGIKQNRAQARQALAHRYLERFNGPVEIASRTMLHDFYSVRPKQQCRQIAKWKRMSYREKLDTVQGLNFWEELGGMYNRGLIDREIVTDYFGAAALGLSESSRWFVDYLRRGNPKIMEQFHAMCIDIEQRRRTSR
jgi:hypothetical protein